MDAKAQRIIKWRETFETLPDENFFGIMRMYLGEIKTPYNKTKLIESLGAFIRNEENKQTLLSLLSIDDLKIISAVHFISGCNRKSLASFFSAEYSTAVFYERLSNLEERLILFSYKNEIDEEVLGINPLLEDELIPLTGMSYLIRKDNAVEPYEKDTSLVLNLQLLCAFISYVYSNPEMCKMDGTFKIKRANELLEIFGDNLELLQLLTKALVNLGIFVHDDKKLNVNFERLLMLSKFPEIIQISFIVCASCAHFTRSSLQKFCGLFLQTMKCIPEEGYSLTNLCRVAKIISENKPKEEVSQVPSRFAQLMAHARSMEKDAESAENVLFDHGIMEYIFDNACIFGILEKTFVTKDGDFICKPNAEFLSLLNSRFGNAVLHNNENKFLNVDGAFNVTVMPGVSLGFMSNLLKFMVVKKFDTAVLYEINRKSVMRAFDCGMNNEDVFCELQKYSLFELPQGIEYSINEWYESYSSAAVYFGYVLKVSGEKIPLVENNPVFKEHLLQVLADGVYLLNVSSEENLYELTKKLGLEFVGDIKKSSESKNVLSFPQVRFGDIQKVNYDFDGKEKIVGEGKIKPVIDQKQYLENLRSCAKELEATEDQLDGLMDRIARKVVLNKNQLVPKSVKPEFLEALGIDYTGKLHVIESAISTKSMLEVETEGSAELLVGYPIDLMKYNGYAFFRLKVEPDGFIANLDVGTAVRIKKIRTHFTLGD